MDELKDKITEEELENVAGGLILKPYLHCEKCGCTFFIADADKYSDYDDNQNRIHKGCGGALEVVFKAS